MKPERITEIHTMARNAGRNRPPVTVPMSAAILSISPTSLRVATTTKRPARRKTVLQSNPAALRRAWEKTPAAPIVRSFRA